MTNPDDLADHLATGPADDSEVIAGAVADAAERIADTWGAGAKGGPRLTATQLRALRALELRPAVSLTALAARLDMGLPAASRMCDRLEAAGLVARTVHPFSRRAIQLALTTAGHHVMREVSANRVRILAGVVRKMRPAERGALRRGIAAFQRAAQAGEGGA